MKSTNLFAMLSAGMLIAACSSNTSQEMTTGLAKQPEAKEEKLAAPPTIEYSFSFVGCNRVERGDQKNPAATNASSANISALKRIFDDVTSLQRKPDAFFFLGDLVYAESTLALLGSQLPAWVAQYQDPAFSSMASSGIEMIAVPGNHEMLSWADHNVPGHDEWPLKGATELWLKHMAPYMPKDREDVGGDDAKNNALTFAFTRKNVGFVVMNTDTYNPPTAENPWGLEGQIPTDWVIAKVKAFQADTAIEHIFVLGHKPYYVNALPGQGLNPQPQTGHNGLPAGPVLWPALNTSHTCAMLSAHVHDYQRMQPGGEGTYQIIAGNGGSDGQARFFGYSTINILSNGEVEYIARGYDVGAPYYQAVPEHAFSVRDQTTLTWTANANPYNGTPPR